MDPIRPMMAMIQLKLLLNHFQKVKRKREKREEEVNLKDSYKNNSNNNYKIKMHLKFKNS